MVVEQMTLFTFRDEVKKRHFQRPFCLATPSSSRGATFLLVYFVSNSSMLTSATFSICTRRSILSFSDRRTSHAWHRNLTADLSASRRNRRRSTFARETAARFKLLAYSIEYRTFELFLKFSRFFFIRQSTFRSIRLNRWKYWVAIGKNLRRNCYFASLALRSKHKLE